MGLLLSVKLLDVAELLLVLLADVSSGFARGEFLLCPLKSGPFEAGVLGQAFLTWRGRKRMKASKFTEAQKAFILKQGELGTPVAEICRMTFNSAMDHSIAPSFSALRRTVT